jgi:hypothetical protein
MPNESVLTSRRLKLLQRQLPGLLFFKFNDRVSAGIPDAAVLYKGRCLWIEFKKLAKGQLLDSLIRKVQDVTLRKMVLTPVDADVLVYVFTPDGDHLYTYERKGTMVLRRNYTDNLADYLNDLAN